MTPSYSTTELMALAAAREIRDGEVVFAGTGLPMLGGMLARRRHAPNCTIVFEAGGVDPEMLHLPMSVGDSRTLVGAAQASGLFDVFTYLLQGGRIDVGFLGGGQIDRHGNVNSNCTGDYSNPSLRFPGSGGGCDIASLCKNVMVVIDQKKYRKTDQAVTI